MKITRRLDDWLTAYVNCFENTEPSTLFKFWVGVGVLASALKRKCVCRLGEITAYPNFYIVLVAPPGGRKGTAMRPGAELLASQGIQIAASCTTKEALIRELGQAMEIVHEGNKMITHSSLTVFSEELTVFLGYKNIELMAFLNDWFDCAPQWSYKTKHQGEDLISGVWLNLIGATTPDLIRASMPLDTLGSGLASRIIFVWSEGKAKKLALPTRGWDLWDKLKDDLASIKLMSGEFKVEEKGFDFYRDWYENDSESDSITDPKFAAYVERRPLHLIKTALIMSVSRSHDMVITEGDFKRALVLLRTTEKNMTNVFAGVGRSPMADIMTQVMSYIATMGCVGADDLMEKFYMDADSRTMDAVLTTIQRTGFCKHTIKGNHSYYEHIPKPKDS